VTFFHAYFLPRPGPPLVALRTPSYGSPIGRFPHVPPPPDPAEFSLGSAFACSPLNPPPVITVQRSDKSSGACFAFFNAPRSLTLHFFLSPSLLFNVFSGRTLCLCHPGSSSNLNYSQTVFSDFFPFPVFSLGWAFFFPLSQLW